MELQCFDNYGYVPLNIRMDYVFISTEFLCKSQIDPGRIQSKESSHKDIVRRIQIGER